MHVKEKVFAPENGMRRNVPKVVVAVTDGRSQDEVKKNAATLQHAGKGYSICCTAIFKWTHCQSYPIMVANVVIEVLPICSILASPHAHSVVGFLRMHVLLLQVTVFLWLVLPMWILLSCRTLAASQATDTSLLWTTLTPLQLSKTTLWPSFAKPQHHVSFFGSFVFWITLKLIANC